MTHMRFAVGGWIMRVGLAVMPAGRSRDELSKVLRSWSRYVRESGAEEALS